MSETNDSLQLRTDAPGVIIERLKQHGFNGFVFRGAGGWLTVVPYGGPAGLQMPEGGLARFAALMEVPVLLYQSNDFGWGFEIALPDGRTTEFTRIVIDMAQFGLPAQPPNPPVDEAVLAAVVSVARVQPFLRPGSPQPDDGLEGNRFAKAMGFAEFEFLSPAYVTDDPAEAHRRGGIEIGSRPVSVRGHTSP